MSRYKEVSNRQQKFRHVAVICTGRLLRNLVYDDKDSLYAAQRFLEDGYGLIVVINHFSQRDGLEVIHLLFQNSTMRRRPFLAPVALQHYGTIAQFFANKLGLQLQPIVTDSTIQLLGDGVNRGDGLVDYLVAAIACLRQGGIVLIAPQGGRQVAIGQPTHRPIGSLMAQAKRCGVERLAFMFIGLGMGGETEYTTDIVGDFNFQRVYELRLGETIPAKRLLTLAGGRRYVDAWIFEYLRQLVPVPYGGTSGKSKNSDDLRQKKHQSHGESVYESIS